LCKAGDFALCVRADRWNLQFLWLYYASWRVGFGLKFHFPRLTAEVRRVLYLMIPGTMGAGVMQINLLVDMFLGDPVANRILALFVFCGST